MKKQIPQIGIGTWLVEDKQILFDTIKAGLEAGYKHIDTAQIYNNEFQIGQILDELNIDRNDIFITSKVVALNFGHVEESTKQSLRRLGLEKINLMLLHSTVNEEWNVKAFKDLIKLREEGLVEHVGVSNMMVEDLKAMKEATGEYPYINQIVLAPTTRDEELEAFCKENGILLTGYSIMKAYFDPNPFYPNSGMTEEEKTYVDSLAAKYNKDAGQILNRWATQLGYTIIPKSSKASRVVSNFNIFDFELSEEEVNKLSSFNRFDQDAYRAAMGTFIEYFGGEEKFFGEGLKNGLLFDKNFGN